MTKQAEQLRRKRIIRLLIRLFAWVGVALVYYFGFSLLFDTPAEYRMRSSTDLMREQYDALSERYDSLEMVLDNITARDKSVFRILFESDPYDLETEQSEERLALYERNIAKSKRRLAIDLKTEIDEMSAKTDELEASWRRIKAKGTRTGEIAGALFLLNHVIILFLLRFYCRRYLHGINLHSLYLTNLKTIAVLRNQRIVRLFL